MLASLPPHQPTSPSHVPSQLQQLRPRILGHRQPHMLLTEALRPVVQAQAQAAAVAAVAVQQRLVETRRCIRWPCTLWMAQLGLWWMW